MHVYLFILKLNAYCHFEQRINEKKESSEKRINDTNVKNDIGIEMKRLNERKKESLQVHSVIS